MSDPLPDLSHLPRPARLPGLGNTTQVLADPYRFHLRCRDRFGPVYRFHFLGREVVCLHGADALAEVLENRGGRFANALGWEVIEPLFGGGLLLRDGDAHRTHRRRLLPAFRAEVLRHATATMAARMAEGVAAWPVGRPFGFHAAIRRLARAIAAEVFMGVQDPREADRLGDAFQRMLDATAAPIRRPWPLTRMRRGLAARADLRRSFGATVAARRHGTGRDLFSEMCRLTDDAGAPLPDAEIVDHFVFFLFAAFDTASSSLTATVDELARRPDLQETMAAEIAALPDRIDPEALARLEVTERVFKEALRLMPPVPFLPRGLTDAGQIAGHRLPAGTPIIVCPGLVMQDPAFWTDPARFDPDRFAPHRAEDRAHSAAWAPFGGGVHKCLGMHFAMLEAKCFFAALLPRARIAPRPPAHWRRLPIPRPADGLRITLTPV